jgi:glutamate formiminotransferase / 5-formyltetrahydrofolate cyclo-ligase
VLPLEAVPNVSEGRNAAAIASLADAFAQRARLLDVHSDEDHHRSVFTLVGNDDDLVESLLAGIGRAVEVIDLARHDGVHPRVGAADVVPLVPVVPDDMERAKRAALTLAERAAAELGLPVFLYGAVGGGRRPAFFRRGGPEELQRRVDEGELRPDFGPSRLDPASGAVLVGARPPLVAFNVELATRDVEVARAVAAAVREVGGGFPGVRALGLALPRSGRVQVSMNVEDWRAAPLHEVVARVDSEARAHGVDVVGGELVGLLPAGAALAAAAPALALGELGFARVLELRLLEAPSRTER